MPYPVAPSLGKAEFRSDCLLPIGGICNISKFINCL